MGKKNKNFPFEGTLNIRCRQLSIAKSKRAIVRIQISRIVERKK